MNYRINKKDKFTQIDNDVLRDKELTMEGLAVLVRLLSRGDNWRSNFSELVKNGKEKSWTTPAIARGMKNLAQLGYAKLVKIYNFDEKAFTGSYYEIFEDKELSKLFPKTIYVDNNNNEIPVPESKSRPPSKQTPLLADTSESNVSYIKKDSIKNKIINNNIPSEQKEIVFTDLQTDILSESLLTNKNGNCTISSPDKTIPIKESKSKKEAKDPAIMIENRRFSKDFTEKWNNAGKEKLGQIGYVAINKLFSEHGYDKGMFICNYLCQMYGSNEKSIAKKENHEKALLFYQSPDEEQPRYLNEKKFAYMKTTYGSQEEEPDVRQILHEDFYYAAMEWFYSQRLSGNELVKTVRARIKELNHKYNKY